MCSVNNSPPKGPLCSLDTCPAKQLNSPASYPATPWRPQPLNMLCSSTSQHHLAEPWQRQRPRASGSRSDPSQPTACGSCSPNGFGRIGGFWWRKQAGAALVPHLATPPAPPLLPVWQEPHPQLQGSAERIWELWDVRFVVWRVNCFPCVAHEHLWWESCRRLWINDKLNKLIIEQV